MNRRSLPCVAIVLACVPAISGCDALFDLIRPRIVTAQFVNNGDFTVDLTLYYSDIQDIPELLLTETGEKAEISIPAGATRVFSRDCDDVQAIIIDDADLRVIGGVGPETSTDVLRDGDDFSCGSRITFTFDHSEAIVDFDVTVSVSP
jgi:hypothetical protein